MAYNTSVQATTGFTPFYLVFSWQARIPIDVMYGSLVIESSPNIYASNLKRTLTTAYDKVQATMDTKFQRQKQFYDKKYMGSLTKLVTRYGFLTCSTSR